MRSDKVRTRLEICCLSSDILLKRSRGSAPAVHFSVKDTCSEEGAGNFLYIGCQHLQVVSF